MHSWKRRLMLLLTSGSLLTGCVQTVSSCPPLKTYTPEFNARLADEVEAMPEDSAALRAILDYAALRDQVKACR